MRASHGEAENGPKCVDEAGEEAREGPEKTFSPVVEMQPQFNEE